MSLRRIQIVNLALQQFRIYQTNVIILHEPRVFDGPIGCLRLLQSWLTEKWLRNNTRAVLAIGRNGPRWFARAGYNKGKIIPFAYFVPSPVVTYNKPSSNQIRIGFIGRLVEMKGAGDLIEAIPLVKHDICLHLAGSGKHQTRFIRRCNSLNINAHFHGVVPNDRIGQVLGNIDILVAPSRSMDDGWGVVVSEALMCGIPVISTHKVGASILLDDPRNGRVAAPNNPQAIAEAINSLIDSSELNEESIQQRAMRAKKQISAESGARYLTKIISHIIHGSPRPLPFYQRRQ